MNYREPDTIQLSWIQDAPFRVALKRTIPVARRLPQEFVEPFFPPEEETWRAGNFLSY